MAHHELTFDHWGAVSGRDAAELHLGWERDGTYLGCVSSVVSGQVLREHRREGRTPERYRQALASWMVEELQREVEAGRGQRSEWIEDCYSLGVDELAVEHRVKSNDELPDLVEGEVVRSFDA